MARTSISLFYHPSCACCLLATAQGVSVQFKEGYWQLYLLLAAQPMAGRGNSFKERSTCHTDMLCEKKRLDEGTSFLVYSASQAESAHTQICNSGILETEDKQVHWDLRGEMCYRTASLLCEALRSQGGACYQLHEEKILCITAVASHSNWKGSEQIIDMNSTRSKEVLFKKNANYLGFLIKLFIYSL